jgi:integrase
MPSGCVIRRDGKRGAVFYVWFRDADGRQVKTSKAQDGRTMREADGWTAKKAERELGARLAEVERERWTKPTRETFAAFADEWRRTLPGRNLKRSTVIDYVNTLDKHALPFFGAMPLDAMGPEHFDAYIAKKTDEGLAPKTIANHLATLDVLFKVAKRWRRVRSNPLDDVDRPRIDEPETVVLTEGEVAQLLEAYTLLALNATPAEMQWWHMAGRMVLVVLGTALRRGELLALRWQDVDLLEQRLHVRRSWVRNQMTTPKSRASRRTVPFGLKTAAAIEEQWQASRYHGDDDLVFGHPELGTPLDPAELTRLLREEGARDGWDHEAAAAVARPTAYSADDGRRRRQPERLRSGEGGTLAVLDY